jgi:hypothetical protein
MPAVSDHGLRVRRESKEGLLSVLTKELLQNQAHAKPTRHCIRLKETSPLAPRRLSLGLMVIV